MTPTYYKCVLSKLVYSQRVFDRASLDNMMKLKKIVSTINLHSTNK